MRRHSAPANGKAPDRSPADSSSMTRRSTAAPSLLGVLAALYLIVCFYLGMEWLFFATKASFMDSFSSVGRMGSLLIPPAVLTLAATPLLFMLAWVDGWFPGLQSRMLVPAFFLAACAFLLIDNFTYTVFQFGVVTSGSVARFVYLAVFLLLLLRAFYGSRSAALHWEASRRSHPLRLLPLLLAVAAIVAAGVELATTDFGRADLELVSSGDEARRPNIILLSTDGVEARMMSVYGFPLPSTPFLEGFGQRALVFDNAFPDAGKTTGSLSAMLSGALPSELHVGFPPHIFPKEHALHHLPALLQGLGYTGYQRSIRYYADAGDLNMVSSFDFANGRRLWTPEPGSLAGRLYYLFSEEIQFSTRMANRLVERLLHILAVKPIINHYLLVKEGTGLARETDAQSLDDALAFIRTREGPYFVQVHLMGTHCCRWVGVRPWFDPAVLPADLAPRDRKLTTAYLNSIRDADVHFQSFIEQLEAEGELVNTILVITSDHSRDWDSVDRVPLIVRFPGDTPRGRVERNVSLSQVPATILEYMGIERPFWMTASSLLWRRKPSGALEGSSLLAGEPPILSLARFDYSRFVLRGGVLSRIDHPGPPLYGVREVGLVIGPYWKKLDLQTGKMKSGLVRQHSVAADRSKSPPDSEAREYIVRHLEASGFDLPPLLAPARPTGRSSDPDVAAEGN